MKRVLLCGFGNCLTHEPKYTTQLQVVDRFRIEFANKATHVVGKYDRPCVAGSEYWCALCDSCMAVSKVKYPEMHSRYVAFLDPAIHTDDNIRYGKVGLVDDEEA